MPHKLISVYILIMYILQCTTYVANMRPALCLLVLALLTSKANGYLTDIKGGGCVLQGALNFQGESCAQLIDEFYIGSGLFTQTPGYTTTVKLPSGDCCIYNTRQSCDKVGSDLRLNVDQNVDPACMQLLNVTQSSNSRHGQTVNIALLFAVFLTMTCMLF